MRRVFSVLVVGFPLFLVVVGFVSGFFASLVMGESCPGDVRGFDDSELYVDDFSVENESELVLDVVNDGSESVEVREVRLFWFTPDSEKTVSLNEDIGAENGSQVKINLDEADSCNDIPIEVSYRTSNGVVAGVGSVSAHLE